MTVRRTENGEISFLFPVLGTGGIPSGPDPENKVGDQYFGKPGRSVSSRLQVPGEPGHCRARTRPPLCNSLVISPSKFPSIAPADLSVIPR
jgi:hypothetical protein